MNPELQKALALLARARVAARKDGVKFSPEEEEAFLREETQGKFGMSDVGSRGGYTGLANAGMAFAQGALFNWADELAGLFSKEFGEKLRIRDEAFRRENPRTALALGLAGGLAIPGFGTAKAVKGTVGLGREIAAGAKFGAGAGALAGAGAAGPGDRAAGALIGGAAGGALGGFLPGVIGGVRSFTAPMKAQRLRTELVEGAGGAASIRNRAAALARITPDVTAADAAPTLRGFAEGSLSDFPALYGAVEARIAARQAGANERVATQFAAIKPSEVPAERLARMKADTKAWAASEDGFEGLRQQYDELPDPFPFVRYFTQPDIKKLWAQAEKQGLIGVEIPFSAPFTGSPSFAQVHELIQGLDKAVTSKFQTPGQKQLARQMSDVSDFLKGELGRQVPEAAPVFAEYATRMSREKGLQLGRDLFKATPNKLPDLVVKFRSAAPEAQDEARLALAGELVRRMRTMPTGQSFASIVQKQPALQEKFALAFDNEQNFVQFLQTTGLEDELNKLRHITANSRTAMRTANREKGVVESMAESVVGGSVLAAPVRIPRAGARAGLRGVERAANERVLRELLAPGMRRVDDLLRAASDRRPYTPRLVQGITPAIAPAIAERINALFQR